MRKWLRKVRNLDVIKSISTLLALSLITLVVPEKAFAPERGFSHSSDLYPSEAVMMWDNPCPDFSGNPVIDGDYCDPNAWTVVGVDAAGDTPTATADVLNLYTAQNGDSICFAWSRLANGAGTSTFKIFFDGDCDGDGDDLALDFVWNSVGSDHPGIVTLNIRDGNNQVVSTSTALQGYSICGDPLSNGKYIEYCVSLTELLDLGLIDPCCGILSATDAGTYAGGSINSANKDEFDLVFNPPCYYINSPPEADFSATVPGCTNNLVCFDGTLSSDFDEPEDSISYQWDFSYNGSTFNIESTDSMPCRNFSNPGTYTIALIVTDRFNCSDTSIQTYTIFNQPTIFCFASPADCNGTNTGSINITVFSGLFPFTYEWDNGVDQGSGTGTIINDLYAGDYTVILTDANGCSDTCQATVTEPSPFTCSVTLISGVNCFGESNGSASVSVTGGSGGFNYLWDNNETGVTATMLDAGTHSVTVTDGNGCSAICSVEVPEPEELTCNVLQDAPVICYGASDGTATVTAMGGIPTYSYLWDNNETTRTATSLNSGSHTVTVTDGNGCTTTCTVEISEPDSLYFDPAIDCDRLMGLSVPVVLNSNGGIPPYQYSIDGVNFSNVPASDTILIPNGSTYTITLRDANQCETDRTLEVICCTINCPADATVDCGDSTSINVWLNSYTLDGCVNSTIQDDFDPNGFIGNCGVTGFQIVTFQVIENGTNRVLDECQATLTIIDTIAPVIDCPNDGSFDLFIECDRDYSTEISTWLNNIEDSILNRSTDQCATSLTITNDYSNLIPAVSCDLSAGLDVVFTVMDQCGNSSTCLATIYKDDTVPPDTLGCNLESRNITVQCQGAIANQQALNDWHSGTMTLLQNCADDACGEFQIIHDFDLNSFVTTCGNNAGDLTVNYSLVDSCSNSTDFALTFSIIDTIAPDTSGCNLSSLNVVTECMGISGDPTAITNWHNQNIAAILTCSQDECDTFSISDDFDISNYTPLCDSAAGYIEVNYTLTDDCNNSVSFVATYTIEDTSPPDTSGCNLNSLNVILECAGEQGNQQLITNWHNNNINHVLSCARDDCDTFDITHDFDLDNFQPDLCSDFTGSLSVNYTLTDLCGNALSFPATITIEDTTPPDTTGCDVEDLTDTLECQGVAINAQMMQDWHTANITHILACSYDLCDTFLISDNFDPANFVTDCSPNTGSLAVEYTLSDNCGNDVQFTATLTIEDNIAPDTSGCDFSALNDTIECLGAAPNQSAISDWHQNNIDHINACASETCDGFTVTDDFDLSNFVQTCSNNAGAITVNYTVADDCGNSVGFPLSFVILDTTPPDTSGCDIQSRDQTIECMGQAANLQAINDWHDDNMTLLAACVTEICASYTINHDFDINNFIRTCGGTTGVISVTYVLEDECGNSISFTVTFTIVDTSAPDISGCPPGSLDVQTACGGSTADSTAVAQWHSANQTALLACAFDQCDTFALTDDFDYPNNFILGCGNGGSITVNYTFTDSCGNTSVFTAIYSTSDITPPDTTGCNLSNRNITLECAGSAGNDALMTSWHNDNITHLTSCIADACSGYSLTHDFDVNNFDTTCGIDAGILEVIYTATDQCNNSISFTLTLTIEDTSPPDLDGCDLGSLDITTECFGVDSNQQTYLDWHNDNLAYLATCAADLCSGIIITHNFDYNNFTPDCGPNSGTYEVIYTVSDSCGNATSFTASRTFEDTTPPDTTGCNIPGLDTLIECRGDAGNMAFITNWHNDNLAYILGCAKDSCNSFSLTSNFDLSRYNFECNADPNAAVKRYDLDYTLTDNCGNSIDFTATVHFDDTMPPDTTGCNLSSRNITVECQGQAANEQAMQDWHDANVAHILACASDLCETFTLDDDFDLNNFVAQCGPNTGILEVTYTLTDRCDNAVSFTLQFTIVDTQLPVISGCQPGDLDVQSECFGQTADSLAVVAWNNSNIATLAGCVNDECSEVEITSDFDYDNNFVFTCNEGGQLPVVYTLMDSCGNSITFDAVYSTVDVTPPDTSGCNFESQNDTISCLGQSGNEQAILAWHNDNVDLIYQCAHDVCDTFTLTHDFDLVNFVSSCGGNAGSLTVNYILSDVCDNIVAFDLEFVILDTLPPDTTGCNFESLTQTLDCTGASGTQQAINDWHVNNITTILSCAVDECDTFAIIHDFDPSNFNTSCGPNTGAFVVNYTLQDSCNNAVSFAAMLTIIDTIPPDTTGCNLADLTDTIDCAGLSGNQQAIADWHDANINTILTCSSDDCDTFDIIHDYDLGNFIPSCGGNAGSITVNYTLTDSCGNTVDFSASLEIVDTIAPDISGCPVGSLDVQTDCSGSAADSSAIAQWHLDNELALLSCAFEECDTFDLSSDYDPSNFVITCGNGGQITVIYTLTDSCGNGVDFLATYSTVDVNPPDTTGCNFNNLDTTIQCAGASANNVAITDWHNYNISTILNCASDACDTFTITHDFDLLNFVPSCGGNAGSITVVYTLTDICNNQVSFAPVFTIVDNTPPDTTGCNLGNLNQSIECLGSVANLQAMDDWHANNLTTILSCTQDACDTFDLEDDYDPQNLVANCGNNAGQITVNYTLTDSCGNNVSFPATFTIEDTTPPDTTGCNLGDLNQTVECTGLLSNQLAIYNWHNNNIATILACSSDDCDTFTITDNYNLINFIPSCGGNAGSITVDYVLTDDCGNSTTFPATFEILDTNPPDTTGCNLVDLSTTIDCSGQSANEQAINSWYQDNLTTILGCVFDECDTFSITDNFDLLNFVPSCGGNAGSITVDYLLSDSCGNAISFSATLTIQDTIPPDLSGCPPGSLDVQTECAGAGADSIAIAQWHQDNQVALLSCATDQCDTFDLTSNYDPSNFVVSCGSGGQITIIYSLSDSCTNTSTFSATYSTVDITPPDTTGCDIGSLNDTLECQGSAANQQAISNWHQDNISNILDCAVDNCDTFSITDDFDLVNFVPSCGGNAGSITVNYTLADSCGNGVSFPLYFVIEDTTPPDTIGCNFEDLNDTIKCLGPTGNLQAIDDWHNANLVHIENCASDACDTFDITDDYSSAPFMNSCGNAGSLAITYTLTDSCGNSTSFQATFTIVDVTSPDLSGCDLDLINQEIQCLGYDGNIATINTWHDNNRIYLDACAVDLCDSFTISDDFDILNFLPSCSGNTGSITVNYVLTDMCGNFSETAATFMIIDTVPPDTLGCDFASLNDTIDCQGQSQNFLTMDMWHQNNIDHILGCSGDVCDTFEISHDYDSLSFNSSCGGNGGSLTVNYVLTDSCGNSVSFTASLQINDTIPPDTTGCNLGDLDATIECLGQAGNEQAIADWHAANRSAVLACAVDDCDTFALTDDYDLLNFVSSCGGNAGSITVNYTLTDSCGNGVSFASTFTIEDTTAPDTTGCNLGDLDATIECLGQAGNEQAIADWYAANRAAVLACAVDDCDTFALTDDYDLLNFVSSCGGNAGSIAVNYTLTDSCGNGVSFASTFTIEDTTAPDTTGCNLGDLDATIECLGQAGNEQAIADWHASNRAAVLACAVDDCDTFALTDDYDLLNFVSSCGGNAGSITVNYTLTDSCGNGVSFPVSFVIEDATPPDTIGCNFEDLNDTIECLGPTGNLQAIDDWHNANLVHIENCASDACDTFDITDDYSSAPFMNSCGNAGSLAITYTLTDSCGNSTSFQATFTIVDVTSPDLSGCDLDLINQEIQCLGYDGNIATINTWHDNNRIYLGACAVDLCDSFTISDDFDILNFLPSCSGNTGSITVNYVLTDMCGNFSETAATFMIIDTVPPDTLGCDFASLNDTIDCQGQSQNFLTMDMWHQNNIDHILGCSGDVCDTFEISHDYDSLSFNSSCGGNGGSLTVNYVLTDSCGNSVSFTASLQINDTIPPDTTGCNLGDLDATIECLGQAGNEQAIADWHAANRSAVLACAVDDCDTFALTDDYDLLNFVSSCGGNAGSITVNYTLTDSCGNGVSFASTFTIEDTTAPDTTGCNLGDLDATIECLGQAGNEQAIADWHAANRAAVLACAVDDCDTFALTDDYDLLNFVSSCGGNAGSITVNYTLTDSCGNGVSFASTFTIEDTTAPDTTGCNLGDLDATIECLGQAGNEQAIADWHAANQAAVLACAVDDCDTFALTDDYDLLNFVSSCGGNAGSITVNYTLTDSCGNGVSFASTFTIEDTTAPDTTGCNLADLTRR